MPRYIDADALKTVICKACNKQFETEPCEPNECEIIEAIEKQIPKKMEKKKCVCYDGEEQEYEVCPDCGVQVRIAGTMTAKYCWNCGQRVL